MASKPVKAELTSRRTSASGYASASEIARLAYCERQVDFDAKFGCQAGPEQRRAQVRGMRAHAEFFRESQELSTLAGARRRGIARCRFQIGAVVPLLVVAAV